MSPDAKTLKLILMADGDTDYLFVEKALEKDKNLTGLSIKLLRPEDKEVRLQRRAGGGHGSFIRDVGKAASKAANSDLDGVIALVDNDGDPRFCFPHDTPCGNCRECDALQEMKKITFGGPRINEAAILYQAVETLVLSALVSWNPQQETELYGQQLKIALFGREIKDMEERYREFEKKLEQVDFTKIKAGCYPRIKALFKRISKNNHP